MSIRIGGSQVPSPIKQTTKSKAFGGSGNAVNQFKGENLERVVKALREENQDIRQSNRALDKAKHGLQKIDHFLNKLEELADKASSKSTTDTQRQKLNENFSEVRSHIEELVSTTSLDGVKLLDGAYNHSIQVGPDAGQTIEVTIGSAQVDDLGINISQLGSREAAKSALDDIKSAQEKIQAALANIDVEKQVLSSETKVNKIQIREQNGALKKLGTEEGVAGQASQVPYANANSVQSLLMQNLFKK